MTRTNNRHSLRNRMNALRMQGISLLRLLNYVLLLVLCI
jgi:hypothetical protein